MDEFIIYLQEKIKLGFFGEGVTKTNPLPKFLFELVGEANKIRVFDVGWKKVSIKSKNIITSWNNLEREYRILEALQNFSVGSPKPYLFDSNRFGEPISVIEYIEGTPLVGMKVSNYLDKTADKLKEIHSINTNSDFFKQIGLSNYKTYEDFLKEIQQYVYMGEKQLSNLNLSSNIIKSLEEVINKGDERIEERRKFFRGNKFVFSHKDFGPENILLDSSNEVRLIDWEYANVSDPAFDISILFYRANMTNQDKKRFLSYYSLENEDTMQRIKTYIEYGTLPNLLWHIDRLYNQTYHLSPKKRPYYKIRLKKILIELKKFELISENGFKSMSSSLIF